MHRLTIDELKTEYEKAYREGKELLKVQINEKEYTLNAIATIRLNAIQSIRSYIKNRIGEIIIGDGDVKR